MLELTLRLVFSLAVVVGLMLLLARFGARRFKGGSDAVVQVVHRQPLSRGSAVAVVTVGGRVLVLGTTEQQVSVLAELDPDALGTAAYDASDEAVEAAEAAEAPVDGRVLELPASSTSLVPASFEPGAARGRTRRPAGAHRAATGAPATAGGPLAGSVLSPQTWRQALAAGRRAS